jgi:hypothetical protein
MDNHSHETVSAVRKSSVFSRGLGAICAVAVAAGILGGCASANLGRSDREIVTERAQQRWNLLVKSDFSGAYAYISPAGRELMKPDAYVGTLRSGFWTGAKVDHVECPSPESCDVDVWIEYRYRGLSMKTPVREKWIKQKGDWWFLLER